MPCARTAARVALTMATVAALTTGCSAVLDQVAVASGGGPAVAAPAAASGDAASALGRCRSRAGRRRPATTGTVRPRLGRRRPQRLRHPQRHAAPRPGPRRSSPAPTAASSSPARWPTRTPGADHLRPRPGHPRRADRPRRRPLRRLATGAQQLAAERGEPRQRPAEPARRRRPDEQKGDGDAATWLPPNRAYRCAYVARQVAVKSRYRLWVTQAERTRSTGARRVPGQPLPTDSTLPSPKA